MIIDAALSPFADALDADVAIIGAGAAGIALARALEGKRLRVVVLAGGAAEIDPVFQSLYDGESIGAPSGQPDQTRARVFGGTTDRWEGWCRPFETHDFRARGWINGSGWPIDAAELAPWYEAAREIVEIGDGAYDETAASESARLAAARFISSDTHISSDTRGVITRLLRGSPPTRFGPRYFDELKASTNVSVHLGLSAVGLVVSENGRRVSGVRYARIEGRQGTLRARQVILAAGGIENARLMLASDAALEPAMGASFSHVGRHFSDHPVLNGGAFLLRVISGGEEDRGLPLYDSEFVGEGGRLRFGLAPSPLLMAREGLVSSLTLVGRSLGSLALDGKGGNAVQGEAAQSLPDATLAAAAVRATFPLARALCVHPLTGIIETRPRDDSRVSLSDLRDRFGVAKPRIDWRIAAQDISDYVTTLVHFARDVAASGVGLVFIHPDAAALFATGMGYCGHHMGTTRMSDAAANGVTDANCKVHGIDNLYCAGSSVFPTPGATYPTLTIVALALRLADHLARGTS